MKRFFLRLIVYPTAGIGVYHTFFDNDNGFGIFIFIIGILGILYDLFQKD